MAPQFKKLTDCPENLREAIDWLIQIRHGGDGQGLGKLAKALKKLIEKVTDDALRSLSDEQDANNKSSDSDASTESPSSSSYQSPSNLLDEIDKRLVKVKDNIEAEKEKLKNHDMPETRQAIKHLEAKSESLEIVKQFAKFSEKHLIPEGTGNMLNKFCAGLEHLLGYNSGMYTGDGIVYGDCDRLRDAVLMFFHGLLESVTNDDNVTTYDGYIGEPNKLCNVIRNLYSSIGRGSEEFGKQVDSVSGWLNKYNEQVVTLTNKVKEEIYDVRNLIDIEISYISSLKSSNLRKIQNIYGNHVDAAVSRMKSLKGNKNGFAGLDNALRDMLNVCLGKIETAVEVLTNSSKNEAFIKSLQTLQNTFKTLPEDLESFIITNFNVTVKDHKNKVEVFKGGIESTINALRDTFMKERLKVALTDLKNAVICANTNALNIGGLNNNVIRTAISAIEQRLKTADDVEDSAALLGLKTGIIQTQTNLIAKELNGAAHENTKELKDLGASFEGPDTMIREHETELSKLVHQAKENLLQAVACAKDNASNLGGLKNKTVAAAIDAIQKKLKDINEGAQEIKTFQDLKNLRSHIIDGQIAKIAGALNPDTRALGVKSGLQQLATSIEAPEKTFNRLHQVSLKELTEAAQQSLENIIAKAHECITTHGGINNKTVKKAIEKIQDKLAKETDSVVTMKALTELKTSFMDDEIKSITMILNKSALTSNVISGLAGNTTSIKAPEKIFSDTHKTTLDNLASNSQDDLQNAIDNAIKYVESSQGSLQKKIDKAFEQVIKSTDRKTQAKELAQRMAASLKDVKNGINESYSESSHIEGKFTKLDNYIENMKGGYEAKLQTDSTNDDSEIKRWATSTISLIITNSLTEANDTITKADKDYMTAVKAQLVQIKSKISQFKKNADINQLVDATSNIVTHFASIQSAIKTKSVYEADKIDRETYFNNLMRQTTDTVSILKAAFQKAYQSSAKAYLSGAIKEIKEKIVTAEGLYQQAVLELIQKIESTVSAMEDKADRDMLGDFHTSLKHFEDIQSAITTKSVFSEDIIERQHFFVNLKSQITNTVSTLHEAYKNAYKSSAKSYLSGAIRAIREKVDEAEEVYIRVIDVQLGQVTFTQLDETSFKAKSARDDISANLVKPFNKLQDAVQANSAFEDDYRERKRCFNNVKKLIEITVTSLSIAYKEAYQKSAKSYLSNAIKEIKDKVKKAEQTYQKRVEEEVQKVFARFKEVNDSNFKDNDAREGLKRFFDDEFNNLYNAIQNNSAFKKDNASRMSCFENLKKIADNSVRTLVSVSEKFEICVASAKAYLDKAFTDAESGIKELGITIRTEVNSAFEQIIAEVYSMFADERKASLKAVKSLVDKQSMKVGSIIEKDRITGIKGLLRWISDKIVNLKKDDFKEIVSTIQAFHKEIYRYFKYQIDGFDDEQDEDDSGSQRHPQSQDERSKNGLPARPAPPTVLRQNGDPVPGRVGMTRPTSARGQTFTSVSSPKCPIEHYIDGVEYHSARMFTALSVGRFTHQSRTICNDFMKFLESMRPLNFGGNSDPLLDIVKSGIQSFLTELKRAYISAYCGSAHDFKWEIDGDNCAKIFLTSIPDMQLHLDELKNKCNPQVKRWSENQINLMTDPGKFFAYHGYIVSERHKQNGELQNKCGFWGKTIYERLVGEGDKHVYSSNPNNLERLYTFVDRYRRVCHLKCTESPKPPTTINQMLHWLCGLFYTPMFNKLNKYFETLFDETTGKEFKVTFPARTGMNIIQKVNAAYLTGMFNNVALASYKILVAILGYGDADGRYACDFYTNPHDLEYPTNTDKCFDLLVEILLRLNHQIRFLFKQCHNGSTAYGWRDCLYGKGVGGSRWQCNDLQCTECVSGKGCKTHPTCGIKSPLQSFLEDGLPGFLPHKFEKPDCKITCSLANHNGIPCKTPMGFRDLSITASHIRTGQRIKDVLEGFCGKTHESLNLLCAYLLCLLRRPPQTLGDMFAFYHNFLEHWKGDSGYRDHAQVKQHKHDAFDEAVKRANFGITDTTLEITSIQYTKVHDPKNSDQKSSHPEGDLFSLLACDANSTPALPCGRYVQPLSLDVRCIFSKTYADLYLSWVVYTTEAFYKLLEKLWKECCGNCNTPGNRCFDKSCIKTCPVKYTNETGISITPPPNTKHEALCNSIVNCQDSHQTLFKYGFTFGSPYDLSGANDGLEKKRTCQDFCNALAKVCDGKSVLAELVRIKIPAFLWAIREKFFYTLVALWLLSLLYLLHIMVIRLDLLHIKSHLHSPSSHRIAAQSLLAAARVGKLAKLTYLQP
ncbi:hypothetical protein BBBOND_0304080 [Babesia bigemina]|uniref:Uncharacterized protein n=1 Tax=Babesia bigemina TaxID=5866 RepID=A0A061DC43_BABBI|nr:hypothetical protein BBBOND_0304080 [Babesia bigemina]CDR96504.1 hypothetical protein BBBOND_0304080 [Babesia bigemina]|eukprot:XP_012768690.1 hypothetical protein BBBOND_0304080 [Babesia bigemina]